MDSYYELTPTQANAVVVEWLDIARHDQGVVRRWSIGFLMSTTYMSEGRRCLRLAQTWDEDGWQEFDAFKIEDVAYIHYIGE